ncbi:diaminopimelate epimerase [Pelosinus sp. UFO1]|uniref:diaminopimelate epimerase n=1 Tax=Pelosinus sp. UFO1 TaxID=484770 RepID=UPI0004D13FAB|nr:diaminopimelate epimerase [Pelosinus sp. UFO1]AIF51279.1 Diaminopimelate epimerase [Pelosinus sp. UFO1]
MDFHFYKYHALGNDYIVIDPNKTRVNLSEENIRLICHRNFGIGSDGILYGPLFQNDSIYLRILNPDGSEAEKSGNGIRIFSRYLFDAGYLKSYQFYIETLGGKVHVELLDSKANQIKVDMGQVTFYSTKIPVAGTPREVISEELIINERKFTVSCLSIGNPHCVIPLNAVSRELAEELGPIIENYKLFPNRINVQFLQVLDRNNIKIEIWERGAGYTLASGSSSCAAASAAFQLGMVDSDVDVHMPGGTISIIISPDGHVHMTGSVTGVSKGCFSDDLLAQISNC